MSRNAEQVLYDNEEKLQAVTGSSGRASGQRETDIQGFLPCEKRRRKGKGTGTGTSTSTGTSTQAQTDEEVN